MTLTYDPNIDLNNSHWSWVHFYRLSRSLCWYNFQEVLVIAYLKVINRRSLKNISFKIGEIMKTHVKSYNDKLHFALKLEGDVGWIASRGKLEIHVELYNDRLRFALKARSDVEWISFRVESWRWFHMGFQLFTRSEIHPIPSFAFNATWDLLLYDSTWIFN